MEIVITFDENNLGVERMIKEFEFYNQISYNINSPVPPTRKQVGCGTLASIVFG
jgi:hypothetical protein